MLKGKFLPFFLILLLVFSFIGCDRMEKLEEIDFEDTVKLKETSSPASADRLAT